MTAATRTKKTKTTPAQQPLLPQTSAAYDLLIAESEKQQLPKHYKTDLEIDRETLLKDDAPATFGWQLRECGTGLYRPTVNALLFAEASHQVYPASLWYIHEDNTLKACSFRHMMQQLLQIIDETQLQHIVVELTDKQYDAQRQSQRTGDYRTYQEAKQTADHARQDRDNYAQLLDRYQD